MIRWIPYAFIRIVLFFIGGIVLSVYLPETIPLRVAEMLLLFLLGIYLFLFFFRNYTQKLFWNPGIVGLFAVFFAGYTHLLNQTQSNDPDHFIHQEKSVQYYKVVINRFSEEKERSWKTEGRMLHILTDQWHPAEGKIVLYFSKNDFKVPFRYGDVLLIKGAPAIVQSPANPGEFDYKRFLAFKNIYHQHFVRKTDAVLVRNDPPSTILDLAIGARMWADATLKRHVTGTREQAIASALVLGVTDGLDNELLTAYAATGAMHVLAVSGLHITIIYMILLWVLKPLLRLRSGQWLLAIISLVLLWAYAFITGLSPSVLRAVTMFSFMALARPTSQSTNIYNTLAASAFCLLMFDPFLIMSVGFQLSYLAVLGIVYLQPVFYRLWEPESWLLDEVWKITCVSIAAQIATLSLGLLYFHQFPNYFLLSNLLAIPGSFLVLIAGIFLLAVSFVNVLASITGLLVTWLIKALNFIVFTLEAFPYSLIENIHITTFQSWLLMGIITVIILLFEYKRFKYVWFTASLVVLFAIVQWRHFNENVNIRKLTVYNVRGHSAIDLIDRGNAYFLTDSVLKHDVGKIRFHIAPNRLASGIRNIMDGNDQPFLLEVKGAKLIRWQNHTILHLMEKDVVVPEGISPDWVIIGNNSVYDLAQLQFAKRARIILDSSNSYFYNEKILAQAENLKVDVYSVAHKGAFDYTIASADL
jgi:competence protein ComEC